MRHPSNSKAFPNAEQHFKLALGWSNATRTDSVLNQDRVRSKRAYFDTMLSKNDLEAYTRITPIRTETQSMQLLKAIRRCEQDRAQKKRPTTSKPVVDPVETVEL